MCSELAAGWTWQWESSYTSGLGKSKGLKRARHHLLGHQRRFDGRGGDIVHVVIRRPKHQKPFISADWLFNNAGFSVKRQRGITLKLHNLSVWCLWTVTRKRGRFSWETLLYFTTSYETDKWAWQSAATSSLCQTVIESISLMMLSSLLLRAPLSLYCACIYYENMHSTVPSITNIIPSGISLKKEGKCLNQSKTY